MNHRFEKILTDDIFLQTLDSIENAENKRIFCCHGIEHLADVARIGYIISLENNTGISKDIIYAACLLHDIGRAFEYENGIPHSQAGADISRKILIKCGYTEDEILLITNAICQHGHDILPPEQITSLKDILYKADKLSRLCFRCPASEQCNWQESQKNSTLIY